MKTFQVNHMTCGHCVNAVTRAVKGIDPTAYVSINLAAKRVEVDSKTADLRAIKAAITEAGYTPVEETASAEPGQAARGASCCGSCH